MKACKKIYYRNDNCLNLEVFSIAISILKKLINKVVIYLKILFLELDCEPLKVKGRSYLHSVWVSYLTDAQCTGFGSMTRVPEKGEFLVCCWPCLMSSHGRSREWAVSRIQDHAQKIRRKTHEGCERKDAKSSFMMYFFFFP